MNTSHQKQSINKKRTDSNSLTLQDLVDQYTVLAQKINQQWPIPNQNQRIFARTLKMMEEIGELSDEILSSMRLQRKQKVESYNHLNLADEFADVLACVILLGIELEIDLEAVMKRKISLTKERLAKEKKHKFDEIP